MVNLASVVESLQRQPDSSESPPLQEQPDTSRAKDG